MRSGIRYGIQIGKFFQIQRNSAFTMTSFRKMTLNILEMEIEFKCRKSQKKAAMMMSSKLAIKS